MKHKRELWYHPEHNLHYWSSGEFGGVEETQLKALIASHKAFPRDIDRFLGREAVPFFQALRDLNERIVTDGRYHYLDIVERDGTVSGINSVEYLFNEEFTVRRWARNDDLLNEYFLAEHTLRDVFKCRFNLKTNKLKLLRHLIPVRNDIQCLTKEVELCDVSDYSSLVSCSDAAYSLL